MRLPVKPCGKSIVLVASDPDRSVGTGLCLSNRVKRRGHQASPRSHLVLLFIATLAIFLPAFAAWPASAADRSFVTSTRLAQTDSPPEPLGPLSDIQSELERLAIRGDLPLEVMTFQPVDRGEVTAWLMESYQRRLSDTGRDQANRTGASFNRLKELFDWENKRWLKPISDQTRFPDRPGYQSLYSDEQTQLMIAPYLRLAPVIREGGKNPWADEGHEVAWTDSTKVGLRGVLYLGRSVVFSGGLHVAEVNRARAFADPLVAGTDFILHETSATISARWGPLRFRLGRDRHQWGPGAGGTLLFSGSAEPFNFAEYQLRLGDKFRILALTGLTSLHQKRYIALHRLTWTPRSDLSVSMSEGARYQANGLHPMYISGIVPYTLVERLDLQDNLDDPDNQQQRNNILWSLDAVWRFGPDRILYCELLADDIATESSKMPTRGGYQLGLSLAPAWQGWDWTLGAEYTRISNFTYSVYYQDLCLCDWEHQGQPIGFKRGPDVEMFLARCRIDPTATWGGRFQIEYIRHGDGQIGQPWFPLHTGCSPNEDNCGSVSAWRFNSEADEQLSGFLGFHCFLPSQTRAGAWLKLSWRRKAASWPMFERNADATIGFSFGLGGY